MHKYFSTVHQTHTHTHTLSYCCAALEHVRTPVAQCRSAQPLTPVPLPLLPLDQFSGVASAIGQQLLKHPPNCSIPALDVPVRLLCCCTARLCFDCGCCSQWCADACQNILSSGQFVACSKFFHIFICFPGIAFVAASVRLVCQFVYFRVC